MTQVVTPLSTTTTLTSSLNPSTYGQPITWTATVTSAGSHGPTGKVKFAGIGVATLNGSGVATFTKTWLNAATYAITAEYEGDEASAPSDSAALNQVVNPATTTTVVTSPANPSTQGEKCYVYGHGEDLDERESCGDRDVHRGRNHARHGNAEWKRGKHLDEFPAGGRLRGASNL